MATVTIRNLDDATKQSLRIRAAQHGVSMEEEARKILRQALSRDDSRVPLGQRLQSRFAGVACATFKLPARQSPRSAPSWPESE